MSFLYAISSQNGNCCRWSILYFRSSFLRETVISYYIYEKRLPFPYCFKGKAILPMNSAPRRFYSNEIMKALIQIMICAVALVSQPDYAQGACEPIPSNRGKELLYSGKAIKSVRLLSGTRIYNKDTDIVYLYDHGDTSRVLVDHRNQVISPFVSIEGRTDSIDVKRGGTMRFYDLTVRSGSVYASYFKVADSLVYYNSNGAETLILVRHPNGLLRKQITGRLTWGDEDTKEWNDKGVLIRRDVKDRHYRYFEHGPLQTYQFDTLITGFVTCRQEYYPNGVLRTSKYYEVMTDSPCHLWRFYNEKGLLTDTIRYRPSSQTTSGFAIVPSPPQMFMGIEQEPDYNGLEYYLNPLFVDVLCQSQRELKGRYLMMVRIDEAGKVSFEGLDGYNAEAITDSLRKIMDVMPAWRPAAFREKASPAIVQIYLTVREAR
jgi:hypothetical protein